MGFVLALALVGRITLAPRPFEGWSPALALASGALGLLAVWMLASATWSDAASRALSEFDRTLLYGLVLVLTGSVAARVGDLSMLLRWTAAAFAAIALAGLLTRLLPDVFPISSGFLPERVSFPLTYWNAMGVACALGAVLAFHLTASGRERTIIRVIAAGLLPPIAVTLYLTFSRGAIWVLPLAFVLYVLLAQPRGLLTALPAAGIPAAIAVKIAYGNELLARADYDTSAAAADQGRHVFLVVLACAVGAAALRAAALPLDRRIDAIEIEEDNRRFLRLALSGGLVIALLLGALAADAPRRLADARATFSEGRYMDYSADLRTRLTSAVDNGRIDNWRVALDGFDTSPLHGTGAGTYRITWDADRPAPPIKVNDGHSLYLEVLSELGIVGLVLLLAALGDAAGRRRGAARRAGAPRPRRLPRRRRDAAGARGDRLGLGDARAVRVVLRGRRRRAGRPRGAAGRDRAHAADRRRAGRARARAHAGAVRLLAGAAGPRAERVRAPRLRRRDRRGAERHGALRHAAGAVDGARLLRRPRWGSSSSPGARWTPPARATPTTGSTPTARRSSTACPVAIRGRTRRPRCG